MSWLPSKKEEQKLPLALLVDREKNRVVLAETNGDMIDILFDTIEWSFF